MEALILAGGRGTRARPYLGSTPKVLAPVGDRRLFHILLENLSEWGVDRILIAAGPSTNMAELAAEQVEFVVERTCSGTAGAVRAALPLVREFPLLVVNGDTLCDLGMNELLRVHPPAGVTVVRFGARCAGTYLLSRAVLDRLAASDEGDLDRFLWNEETTSFQAARFVDVGTRAGWEEAQRW